MSPIVLFKMIKEAIKSIPPVKYALGVATIAATGALIRSFGIDFSASFFYSIVIIPLMTWLAVFASMTQGASEAPAKLFAWAMVIISIMVIFLLVTSVFFKYPLDLRYILVDKTKNHKIKNPSSHHAR